MIAVGKDFVLLGQERAAGVDEIYAGQSVLLRDFLCTQVLLDGERIIRATFDGGIIGNNHAVSVADLSYSGDNSGRRHLVIVQAIGRELPYFQKRRAAINKCPDSVPGQQLAACQVLFPCSATAALRNLVNDVLQVPCQGAICGFVRSEVLGARVDPGFDLWHCVVRRPWPQPVALYNSRPISMRRISLVPAPISYSLASRSRRPAGYSLI